MFLGVTIRVPRLYTRVICMNRASGHLCVSALVCLAVFALGVRGATLPAGAFRRLHTFGNPSQMGTQPSGRVVEGRDGALYGTCSSGGKFGHGTVFKVHKEGDGYQVLHHFGGDEDGRYPSSGLIQASDGRLYGTTRIGGRSGNGSRGAQDER